MAKTETFESEDLRYDFTGDWERTTQRAYEGTYSFGSKNIGHSQQTNAYLTITTDYIEFYWYVSSENNYDWFEFYIDGTRELRESGTKGWNRFSKELPKSEYTFRWRYLKDGSVSNGDDRAYIDNLIINKSESRYFIEDNQVLKIWNADTEEYVTVTTFDEVSEEIINLTSIDLSEEVFMNYGMESLVESKSGLIDNKPKIHYFTNEEDVIDNPSKYALSLTETVTSLPRIVIENEGRTLREKIDSVVIDDSLSGTGDIKYALSKDKKNWYAFDINSMEWQIVDVTNDADFAVKGMRKIDFAVITNTYYEEIFQSGDKMHLAFRFYKDGLADECKFKAIKINYVSSIDISI